MKRMLLIVTMLIGISVSYATPIKPHIKATVDSVYICQSRAAYAYHSYECRGLSQCTHVIVKIPKAQAIKQG